MKTGQKYCPQCRAPTKESTIIKRLYLTEPDLSSTQIASIGPIDESADVSETFKKQHENLLILCEELKTDLRSKKTNYR